MRKFAAIAFVSLSCSLAPAVAQTDAHHAGQLFRQRCASCHQAPDLRFATDRAWLDQVNRTA